MATKISGDARFWIQKCASKAVAAAFNFPITHVIGEFHDPMAQLMRCGESHPLSRAFRIQSNQYVFAILSCRACPIKAVKTKGRRAVFCFDW